MLIGLIMVCCADLLVFRYYHQNIIVKRRVIKKNKDIILIFFIIGVTYIFYKQFLDNLSGYIKGYTVKNLLFYSLIIAAFLLMKPFYSFTTKYKSFFIKLYKIFCIFGCYFFVIRKYCADLEETKKEMIKIWIYFIISTFTFFDSNL